MAAAVTPPADAVAVIIPTRNRPADVAAALGDLARQEVLPHEVIIIDDSDGDDTGRTVAAAQAAGLPFPVRYEHAHTGALPRARNRGVDLTACPYVLFLDDDARVRPDFVGGLRAPLLAPDSPYAGGCAMWTDDPAFRPLRLPDQSFKRFFRLGHYGDGRFQVNGMPRFPAEQAQLTDTEMISGGFFIMRTEVYRAFRFDETLRGYAVFEDIDFSWRVSRRHRLFYQPAVIVCHAARHAVEQARIEQARMHLRNYCWHFRKNVPKTPRALLAFARAVTGLYVRAVQNRVLSQVRGYTRALWEALRTGCAPA